MEQHEEETEVGMGPQVDGGERENGGTVFEGKDERSGEPRERRHPRAHFRFGAVEGDENGGGEGSANSRDINSVLALGGLQRRKLRAEGEYYPPASSGNPPLYPIATFPLASPRPSM